MLGGGPVSYHILMEVPMQVAAREARTRRTVVLSASAKKRVEQLQSEFARPQNDIMKRALAVEEAKFFYPDAVVEVHPNGTILAKLPQPPAASKIAPELSARDVTKMKLRKVLRRAWDSTELKVGFFGIRIDLKKLFTSEDKWVSSFP
jgi:hypothetical protein